nr:MAG: hypothetical protein [Betatorquevirus sp.]
MTSFWRKPTSSLRQQELKWINLMHESHDFFCHCDEPDLHFLVCINKFSTCPKPELDIKNIKCLLTGDTTRIATEETTTGEDGGFLDGELETLFDENNGTEQKDDANTR